MLDGRWVGGAADVGAGVGALGRSDILPHALRWRIN